MSCNIALRRSPKPGAFTAHTLMIPRMLFTTSVANASPSTSSAMIRSGLPVLATASNTVINSRMLLIFLSTRRMNGFSSSAVKVSGLFAKYGLI